MINFRIYEMNEHKLLASQLTKEEAIAFVNDKKKRARIMAVKYDTEKKIGDEVVNIETMESYALKDMSCVDLKREIVKKKTL